MEDPVGTKCNIIQFFCDFPAIAKATAEGASNPEGFTFEDRVEAVQQFWDKNGTILEVCKFQKNPIKNLIFNKKTGVDLMNDHVLFERGDFRSEV